MSKNKRIVTPTDEEVAAYAHPGEDKSSPAQDPAGPAAADASDQQSQQATTTTEPKRSEADEWKEKFLRAKADFANYQKRMEKERADLHRYAIADLAKALIPILDDLDRVIETGSAPGATAENLVKGVKLVRQNLMKALGQFNVQQIEAQGQPFDPMVHEAMLEQHAPELPDKTVVQEVSRGYRLHDRLLRPARVIVSKGGPAEPPADQGQQEPPA